MKLRPRNPALRIQKGEIIGDGFAGGGGAGLGMSKALGRKVDIAMNHDPEAVAMYKANHPDTEVYIEDIYDVDPRVVCRGFRPACMWFSPDCTEHSRCKNKSIKRDRKIRSLANVIPVWARSVRPRVIIVENVLEFEDWGPLDDNDCIDPLRKSEYFQFWWKTMESMGYRGEKRYLRACDYGAPTTRERLYIVWRCDGGEIGWPDVSHGPQGYVPYRTAAECIDYSLPCPSIFLSKSEAWELKKNSGIECRRPLSPNTLARIGTGMIHHVLENERPFVIPVTHPEDRRTYDITEPFRTVTGAKRGEFALIAPTMVQTGYGERPGQRPRYLDIRKPLGVVISGGDGGNGKHALVAAYLTKEYSTTSRAGGWNGSQGVDIPASSITCRDHHRLVLGHLVKFRGTSAAHLSSSGQSALQPLDTIAANGNHFGEVRALLSKYGHKTRGSFVPVKVGDQWWAIADIGFRMLSPRELYRAQGFPDWYVIDPLFDYVYRSKSGRERVVRKPLTLGAQTEKCGNSVSPPMAYGIVRANFPTTAADVEPMRWAA